MAMKTKTMEFEHLIVKYDYSDGTLLLRTKSPGPAAVPDAKGYSLDAAQVAELREAFEGIGQQIPITPRPRR